MVHGPLVNEFVLPHALQVTMNTQLYKGMKYHQAQATFHQWRDSKNVYGLNFQDGQVAQKFAAEVQNALDRLEGGGGRCQHFLMKHYVYSAVACESE